MAHLFADAKHRPQGAIGEVEGVGNATTGSVTDKLTREHRMTLDEAHLILNAKRGEAVERILQVRPSGLRPSLLRANFCLPELRTLVQSQRGGGSVTHKCARGTGRGGDTSAFTLPAVKGGAGTRADRGRTGDCKGRAASNGGLG
jgi:hypothetical protein